MDEVTAALGQPTVKGFVVLATAVGAVFAVAYFGQVLVLDLLEGGPTFSLATFAYALAVGIGLYFGRVRSEDDVTAYTASGVAALAAGATVVLIGNVADAVGGGVDGGDLLVGVIVAALVCLVAGVVTAAAARQLDPEELFEPTRGPAGGPQAGPEGGGGLPEERRGPR